MRISGYIQVVGNFKKTRMDKTTKEAWTGNKNNLTSEAQEKRKSINKKIFKFGCLPIIIIVGLLLIIGIFSDSDKKENSTTNIDEPIVLDSIQIKEQQRVKDSLSIVSENAKKALKTFKKNEDEFKGISFYRDPRTPNYTNVNFIYPYIGKKGDDFWLRLKLQYASDDWLFINKGILLVDGEQYTITGTWERDNNSGIWEWLDMQVGQSERIILDRIANSETAKVRYEGTQYHDDRTITKKEKDIIKKTLEIYDNLK